MESDEKQLFRAVIYPAHNQQGIPKKEGSNELAARLRGSQVGLELIGQLINLNFHAPEIVSR